MGEKYIYIYGGFNQKLIYKSGVSSAGGYVHICTLFMYIYIYTSCTGYVLLSIGSYINILLWVPQYYVGPYPRFCCFISSPCLLVTDWGLCTGIL